MPMRPPFRMPLCVAIACTAVALPAAADPWTMPAGQGRVIMSGIYSQASDTYDDQGHARKAPRYEQDQLFIQAEYGVTNDLTVIATPSLRRVAVDNGTDSSGLGYTQLGARYRLFDRGGLVVSTQESVFIPGIRRSDRVAQIGSTDFQAEIRMQAGYAFKVFSLDAFGSADGAYRFRTNGQPDEFHGDITLGVHATPRLLLLANSFGTWSHGTGSGGAAYRYDTVYAGAAYDLNSRLTLQLGGLATVSGRNALRERGVYTGLWIRF